GIRKRLERARPGAGAVVQSAPAGYRLETNPNVVDAEEFRQLVGEARVRRDVSDPAGAAMVLREALALWRGEPLADAHDSVALEAEAARLAEARLDAIEDWADAELACGHPALVLGEVSV